MLVMENQAMVRQIDHVVTEIEPSFEKENESEDDQTKAQARCLGELGRC